MQTKDRDNECGYYMSFVLTNPYCESLYKIELLNALRTLSDTNITTPKEFISSQMDTTNNFYYCKLSESGKYGIAYNNTGVYTTVDCGQTWTLRTAITKNASYNNISISASGKYAIYSIATSVFYSKDYCNSFIELSPTGNPESYRAVAVSDNGYVLIILDPKTLYISNNEGLTFTNPIVADAVTCEVSQDGKYMYIYYYL